jgi:hypothetical protein
MILEKEKLATVISYGEKKDPDFPMRHSDYMWECLMALVLMIEEDGFYLQTTRNKERQFAEFSVGDQVPTFIVAKGSAEQGPDAKFIAIFEAVHDYILKYDKN